MARGTRVAVLARGARADRRRRPGPRSASPCAPGRGRRRRDVAPWRPRPCRTTTERRSRRRRDGLAARPGRARGDGAGRPGRRAGRQNVAEDLPRPDPRSRCGRPVGADDSTTPTSNRRVAGRSGGRRCAAPPRGARAPAGGLPTVGLAYRLACSSSRTLLGDEGLGLLAEIADDAAPTDDDAVELHAEVAALASELGRHDEARERWLHIAQRRTDGLGEAMALLEASKAAYQLGRAEQAIDYIDRARRTGAADELLALDLDGQQAAVHLWLERRTDIGRSLASDVGRRARALATRAGGVDGLD